jgi:hypothetical protein
LQALPVLERLIDALLAMDITAQELTNGVINTAFVMLFKVFIRLKWWTGELGMFMCRI